MLQTLSSRLADNLRKANLEEDEKDNFIQLLLKYKKNQYIYPAVFTRETGINSDKIYKCLLLLEDSNYLKRYYEVGCLKCFDHNSELYQSLDDIPSFFYCQTCNEEKDAMKNSAVIFQVIGDE